VPIAIGSGRGLYRGTTFDREGNMICTFAQEMVLREQ
jgi:acyl-CoA thioesterase